MWFAAGLHSPRQLLFYSVVSTKCAARFHTGVVTRSTATTQQVAVKIIRRVRMMWRLIGSYMIVIRMFKGIQETVALNPKPEILSPQP